MRQVVRGVCSALLVALSLSVTPSTSANASYGEFPFAGQSEIYRGGLRLPDGRFATITFERHIGSAYHHNDERPEPNGEVSYYGCVHVSSAYFSGFETCGPLDVMTYDYDPSMNRMRVHFDMHEQYGSRGPRVGATTVNLVIQGRGPIRQGDPEVRLYEYNDYNDIGAAASTYFSRRAVARGTINVGFGAERVRYAGQRGFFERRAGVAPVIHR